MNHVESDAVPSIGPAPSLAFPPPRQPPPNGIGPDTGHETSITENGAFATARCTCGWFAPARRSRDKARRDEDGHLETEQSF